MDQAGVDPGFVGTWLQTGGVRGAAPALGTGAAAQVTAARVTPAQVTPARVPAEAVLEQLQPRMLPVPIPRVSGNSPCGSGAGATPPAESHLPGALGTGCIGADMLQGCPAEPRLPPSSALVSAARVWDAAAST